MKRRRKRREEQLSRLIGWGKEEERGRETNEVPV